jgi:branched-chain amino acid transport system ATP-binding protein
LNTYYVELTGKSTALKAICGLVSPQSGQVFLNNETVNGKQPFQLVKKGLSLVPEGRRIFQTMSVFENIEMGAFTLKDKSTLRKNSSKVFHLFPVLEERKKQKAGLLSSGEQQILDIARALILSPKLLLLDEPSLGLSPNFVDNVFKKIKEINKNGTTVLLVEQNARMALEYSDRAYVFNIGKIAMEDKAKDLLENEKVKKLFLGGI